MQVINPLATDFEAEKSITDLVITFGGLKFSVVVYVATDKHVHLTQIHKLCPFVYKVNFKIVRTLCHING